jgi:hypothetical protein
MPGGLLNLVSYGNQNIILNGNPSKTFFKTTYNKYTNFGLQKFRIDFDGQRILNMNEPSVFKFKIPRYADLLMDTYFVVTLPHIWSPIMPPSCINNGVGSVNHTWRPYEFKWIKNLGTQMIESVRFTIGGQIIQEYTGDYLYNLVERDFSSEKKDLYYKMTGNVNELNDPANSNGRVNMYPSVMVGTTPNYDITGPEPSIRSRKIYVPLNIWFTLLSKMAFPLVSLQYIDLNIEITVKPVKDLFVIRNVNGDEDGNFGYYQRPNFSQWEYSFYRFIQPPPDLSINQNSYTDLRTNWNADIHLISTYAFLSEDEVRQFASKEQKYLVRQSYTTKFNNIVGSNRVDLKSLGMVCNWMWFFQRSDVNLRNEWSNYTNWPYDYMPSNIISPENTTLPVNCNGFDYYASTDLSNNPTGIYVTGEYNPTNDKNIMTKWALLLDGKYRENELDADIFNYVEKYVRTSGNSGDGLYCYNFCLNTNTINTQPSGAINLSKFKDIQFEVKTIIPVLDPSAQLLNICSASNNGQIIGVNKSVWNIYDYTYDLTVMEERYNILVFNSGLAGLMFAR